MYYDCQYAAIFMNLKTTVTGSHVISDAFPRFLSMNNGVLWVAVRFV